MDIPNLTSVDKILVNETFVFKGTYTIGGFINENSENFQTIDSSNVDFYEKKPTYNAIVNRVHKNFGKEATFANVVWDIRHINFLGLKGKKYISVMFDVYLPKEKK